MRQRARAWTHTLACAALVAVGPILLALSACAAPPRDPDIILITLDDLRPDHLGIAGHPGAHTPHIDALMAAGMRFTQATTPRPEPLAALASLMTGLWPHRSRLASAGTDRVPFPTLPSLLSQRGYRTLGTRASPAGHASDLLALDFDAALPAGDDPDADQDRVADLIVQAGQIPGDQPLLLWAHLRGGAWPFSQLGVSPPGCGARAWEWAAALGDARLRPGWFEAGEITEAARRCDVATYDQAISAADEAVGALLRELDARRGLDDTLVILASTRGRSFDDRIPYQAGQLDLSDASIRVALAFAGPGIPQGSWDGVARLEDVLPTLLALIDQPSALTPLSDGAPLMAALRPDARPDGRVAVASGIDWIGEGLPPLDPGMWPPPPDPGQATPIAPALIRATRPRAGGSEEVFYPPIWPGPPAHVDLAARTPDLKLVARPAAGGGWDEALYELRGGGQALIPGGARAQAAVPLQVALDALANSSSTFAAPARVEAAIEALPLLGGGHDAGGLPR